MSAGGIAARIAQLQLEHIGRQPNSNPKMSHVKQSKTEEQEVELTDQNVKGAESLNIESGSLSNTLAKKSALTVRYEIFQQKQKQNNNPTTRLTKSSVVDSRFASPEVPPPLPPRSVKQARGPLPATTLTMSSHLPSQATPPMLPVRPAIPVKMPLPAAPEYHCLYCRDFSAVDQHASRFPRAQVTSLDRLSKDLTLPFHTLTDKARAIFVWLHHNISYDTESFFSKNLKASTPSSTFSSGLAVCEGYAGLFVDLASRCGIEAKTVSGFGKGFGFIPPTIGSSIPKFEMNHAWNAVKLEGGKWHLIDSCWGAGYVEGGSKKWVTEFNPRYFCASSTAFGRDHFPEQADMQLCDSPKSWESFIMAAQSPMISKNSKSVFEVNENTLVPRERRIHIDWHEFFIEPICSNVVKMDCLLMVCSPSGKRTAMRKSNGGWKASVNVDEKGSWWCSRAIGNANAAIPLTNGEWDPYRYGGEGLCGWECVWDRVC